MVTDVFLPMESIWKCLYTWHGEAYGTVDIKMKRVIRPFLQQFLYSRWFRSPSKWLLSVESQGQTRSRILIKRHRKRRLSYWQRTKKEALVFSTQNGWMLMASWMVWSVDPPHVTEISGSYLLGLTHCISFQGCHEEVSQTWWLTTEMYCLIFLGG